MNDLAILADAALSQASVVQTTPYYSLEANACLSPALLVEPDHCARTYPLLHREEAKELMRRLLDAPEADTVGMRILEPKLGIVTFCFTRREGPYYQKYLQWDKFGAGGWAMLSVFSGVHLEPSFAADDPYTARGRKTTAERVLSMVAPEAIDPTYVVIWTGKYACDGTERWDRKFHYAIGPSAAESVHLERPVRIDEMVYYRQLAYVAQGVALQWEEGLVDTTRWQRLKAAEHFARTGEVRFELLGKTAKRGRPRKTMHDMYLE